MLSEKISFQQYTDSLPEKLTGGKEWHRTKSMPCPLLNKCCHCKQYKSVFDFYEIKPDSKVGRRGPLVNRVHNYCKDCQSLIYKSSATELKLFYAAKRRATQKDLEFALKVEDIKIPNFCPMLGIPLFPATGKHARDNSPTLDRIDSRFGYTPDNILVISHRANTIKGNATIQELEMIADYIDKSLQPH